MSTSSLSIFQLLISKQNIDKNLFEHLQSNGAINTDVSSGFSLIRTIPAVTLLLLV